MFFQRHRFMFVLVFLLATLISTGGIFFPEHSIPAHAATAVGATITLSNQTVHPGQQLTVTGSGLTPQTPFQLLLGKAKTTIVSYIWSDDNGNLTNVFLFPNNYITQGTYTLNLYSEDSTLVPLAQTVIKVVPTLFHITGNSGLPVTITGAGFNAYETVEVYFGTSTSGINEGTTTSDVYGTLSHSLTIPSGLAPGTYSVTVTRTQQTPATITGKIILYPLKLSAPSSARDEQTVVIKGTGFAASEYVTLTWNANGGQQLYADQNGNFTQTIQANGLVSGQTYHVTASNFSNVSTLSVVATFIAQ